MGSQSFLSLNGMSKCLICQTGELVRVLDLGRQPVSCQFFRESESAAAEFPLALGCCDTCGTLQLEQPLPIEALRPRFEWLSYREPEHHLDRLADTLCGLARVTKDSPILGVSFKDCSVIERLSKRGFANSYCLDVHSDLGATDPNANIESVHALLTPDKAAKIAAKRGDASIVIARHVLEHASDPAKFIEALTTLIGKDGYLVLEVPDCSKNLVRADYTMIWEEHTLYFTEATFRQTFSGGELKEECFFVHPYAFEDVLILILRKMQGVKSSQCITPPTIRCSSSVVANFSRSFTHWTQYYRETIRRLTGDRPAALYGAGHLTVAFINYHRLWDLFSYVVDDTAQKQGLKLPNSGIDIVPSSQLTANFVPLCLLGLSPDIEDRVIEKNMAYVEMGGSFRSIFADSHRTLRSGSGRKSG